MKIMQEEENIQQMETRIERRFQFDTIPYLFFVLGMFLCAYLLHHFML